MVITIGSIVFSFTAVFSALLFLSSIVLPITVGIISSIVRAAGWTKETKPITNDTSSIPPPSLSSSTTNIRNDNVLSPSGSTTNGTPSSSTNRRIRIEENKYERRSSRLDLHGDLIRPFRAPENNTYTQNRRGSTFGLVSPTPPTIVNSATTGTNSTTTTTTTVPLGITLGNDMIGWYNLMIVVLFTYVVSNAIHACVESIDRHINASSSSSFDSSSTPMIDIIDKRTHSWLYNHSQVLYVCFDISTWFLDRGTTVTNLFIHTPALVRDIFIIFIFYITLTYGIQLTIKYQFLRKRWSIITVQTMAELALFFGPCIYARTSACVSWPVTQRLAFLMEAAVLTMKMHSYFAVNRHLAKEISLGGPGTGEKVLEAAALEAKREREAQESSNGSTTTLPQRSSLLLNPSSPVPSIIPLSPEVPVTPPRTFMSTVYTLFQALNTHIRKESNIEALEAAAHIGRASGTSIGIANILLPSTLHGEGESTTVVPKKNTATTTIPELPLSPVVSRTPGESTAESESTVTASSSVHHPILTMPLSTVQSSIVTTIGTKGIHRNESSSHLRALAWIKHAAETTTGSIQSLIRGKTDEGRTTTLTQIRYPNNITFSDFLNYSLAPTLCYEPNYPRTEMIELAYIVEKLFLATGLIFAGLYLFSNYMAPVLHHINELTLIDALAQLILPTIAVTLILFFVIFECILNACAEITYFADRNYYHDWWNSTSFAEFSRKWNTPVHEFLLRHIFLDTMLRRGASPTTALYLTYIISILVHEFVIWGALGIVTPYLGILSTVQFPLMTLLRLPIFRGRRLGNMFFWAGLMIGLTLILVMYAKEFYQLQENPPPPLSFASIQESTILSFHQGYRSIEEGWITLRTLIVSFIRVSQQVTPYDTNTEL